MSILNVRGLEAVSCQCFADAARMYAQIMN
jgi:hypothetical protein